MDSTLFLPVQTGLTQGQQAILYLIPLVGVVVSWIILLLKKLRIEPPEKTFALILVLAGSVVLSFWLMPEIALAERINFLVPQIFGGAGVAVLAHETKKDIVSKFSQPGQAH